jgi:hypothetical protein
MSYNILNNFFGFDPINGDIAKKQLIAIGQNGIELLISNLGNYSINQSSEIRLSELSSNFENLQDCLIDILEKGSKSSKQNVIYIFNGLNKEPTGSKLINILKKRHDFDTERAMIDSLGFLGAYGYINDLYDLVTDGKNTRKDNYVWDKLSQNIFMSLVRMTLKGEKKSLGYSSYDLPNFDKFLELTDESELESFYSLNQYSISSIFAYLKPVATDAIINDWINNSNLTIVKLGLDALRGFRLQRITNVLDELNILHKENHEIRSYITSVLCDIPKSEAADLVKLIYQNTPSDSKYFKSICTHLAICLDRISDKDFVKNLCHKFCSMDGEISAHTYYNMGFLEIDKNDLLRGINSSNFMTRGAVALAIGRLKIEKAFSILLKMEAESSHITEKLFIYIALVNAGMIEKGLELKLTLAEIQTQVYLSTLRYTWKRELILALKKIDGNEDIKLWEKLLCINAKTAEEELLLYNIGGQTKNEIVNNSELSKIESRAKKVFISYSKYDGEDFRSRDGGVNYLDEFKALLSPLTKHNMSISAWEDTLLIAGEDWDDIIKSELNSADIIFLLVSNDFLYTNYIANTELKIAFERERRNECIVVPIIIRDCGWESIDWLSKTNALPRKGHTISSWKRDNKFASKDAAWKEVYDEIEKLIYKLGN